MSISEIHDLTNVVLNILTIIAGLLGGLWVYAKYIIERGFVPASQLDIECNKIGVVNENAILDVAIHINNVGTSTLVARNITLDIRYILDNDVQLQFMNNPRALGRLCFPHSLRKEVATSSQSQLAHKVRTSTRGWIVIPHDTFVQPGVDQRYGFTTKVPSTAKCVLIYAAFEYAQKPWHFQKLIYGMSRRFGLVSYSLHHIDKDHDVERAFWIS